PRRRYAGVLTASRIKGFSQTRQRPLGSKADNSIKGYWITSSARSGNAGRLRRSLSRFGRRQSFGRSVTKPTLTPTTSSMQDPCWFYPTSRAPVGSQPAEFFFGG